MHRSFTLRAFALAGAVALASCSPTEEAAQLSATTQALLMPALSANRMTAPRSGHTATLLLSGKVLITGGYSTGSAPIATAELYDPATRTFTAMTAMHRARASHQAALLSTGKVLVVGGDCGTAPTPSSAELYDPATGRWSALQTLSGHCGYFTATVLPSGKVLVVGGKDRAGASFYPTAAVDLYDPASGTWSKPPILKAARYAHTATLLTTTQQVLVAGGWTSNGPTTSMELYNIASNTWSYPVGDNGYNTLKQPRAFHTATLLSAGSVLLAGGTPGFNRTASATAETFFAGPKATYMTASLTTARYGHEAVSLANGHVFIAGGVLTGGATATPTAEDYDPTKQLWFASGAPSAMTVARSGHAMTRLASGDVLVTGGLSSGTPSATAELFPGNWIDWRSARGGVPSGAIEAGHVIGSGTCYPCSAQHNGGGAWNTHPGKLCQSNGLWSCFIGNGGVEQRYEDYKVLTGKASDFTWVSGGSASPQPSHRVWGGWVVDSGDCYLCRAWHFGGGAWNLHPGKQCLYRGRWSCFIGNGGVEQQYESYDVLTSTTLTP